MSHRSLVLAFVIACGFALVLLPDEVAASTFNTADPVAVSTFHSIGLYWANTAASSVTVQYRVHGSGAWQNAQPLWFDNRPDGHSYNQEHRGSIVDLDPGTSYDIQLTPNAGLPVVLPPVSTWKEVANLKIKKTVFLPAHSTAEYDIPDTVDTSGDLDPVTGEPRYVLYTFDPAVGSAVIDFSQNASFTGSLACMRIHAHHVIIRGLTLNCAYPGFGGREGIILEGGDATHPPAHDVVIDGNDITGWGGISSDGSVDDEEGAIYCNNPNTTLEQKVYKVVVQRNRMHDPHTSAKAWAVAGHPAGPQGVFFGFCGTNHVFRYNEIYASNGNHYNDGIGGADNETDQGFPFADSDIYANKISDVYDDAIESEGANRNVRIWGNYLTRTMNVMGNATVSVGPLYIFRNVSDLLGNMNDPNIDPDFEANRGGFVKGGGPVGVPNGGRAYYFHNTTLQPPKKPGSQLPMGVADGLVKTGGVFYNFVSRNNIWHIFNPKSSTVPGSSTGSSIRAGANPSDPITIPETTANFDYDYDLYNGAIVINDVRKAEPAEAHGHNFDSSVDSEPRYADPTLGDSGNYALASTSAGHGTAQRLDNFNDKYIAQFGSADIGAHQSGTPPMRFGLDAATIGPTAHLTAQQLASPPLTVSFDATTSTAGSAAITSYSINFGDGTANGSGGQQTHTYAAAGTYIATLTVFDANNSSATDTISIAVTPPPPPPPPSAFELDLSVTPGPVAQAGESIAFVVTADDGRALQSVQFTLDGVIKATVTAAPFQYTWSSLATDRLGDHTIVVLATDTTGKTSTKTRTLTLLSQACVASGTAASLTQGDPLVVTTNCTAHQTVSQVELSIDGALWKVVIASPWTWSLDTSLLGPGAHTVSVTSRFASGTTSTQSFTVQIAAGPLTVTFNPGPVVMRGDGMTVSAVATDGRALAQVDFYVDGDFQRGEAVPPFEFSWNTMIANGQHVLRVVATDTAGQTLETRRQFYLNTRTCNVLIDTRMYRTSNDHTVQIGPSSIRQGEPVSVEGICSAWSPVQQMEFYLDGVLQSTDTTAPTYTWTLNTSGLAIGNHTIGITGRLSPSGVSNHSIPIEILAP